MAITSASFAPEKRGVQGPDNYTVGMAKNVDAVPAAGTTAESQIASYERAPTNHPVSGTSNPYGTGAGQGTIRKGGRGGK